MAPTEHATARRSVVWRSGREPALYPIPSAPRRAQPATANVASRPIDNLVGDPATVDRARFTSTLARYRELSGFLLGDHVVMATGCNGLHVLEAELSWPQARHRRRSGRNGADLELLDEVDGVLSTRRYTHVMIGSGDGIFATAVAQLRGAGVHVAIVARADATAHRLKYVARGDITYLDQETWRQEGALSAHRVTKERALGLPRGGSYPA